MAQRRVQSSICFLICKLIILSMVSNSTSAPHQAGNYCPNTTAMFANNSQYQANLNTLFGFLSSNATTPSGYYQAVSGNNDGNTNEAIYGHFLCRGDLNASTCQECVTTATTTDLPITKCPNRKEAIIWYDECMVRYSNRSFFGSMGETPTIYILNKQSIYGNEARFLKLLSSMMNDDIAVRAATGGSSKKFATRFVNNTVFQTIYGMGQCTPDLSPTDCNTCLVDAVSIFQKTLGARVFQPSCVVRYEVYLFFDLSSLPSPPPALSPTQTASPSADIIPPSGNGGNTAKISIIIAVSFSSIISLAVGFSVWCCIRAKAFKKVETASSSHNLDENDESRNSMSLLFDFDTIKVATNKFSDSNKLGQGGFGFVYKGVLANGQEIAVKRLSMESGQGDNEFTTEVLLVAKLQHRNLVSLLGFCLKKKERILIYEFVPNASLDHFLFDVRKRSYLNWRIRFKIITGIARGLLYLHEESRLRIIHRDLKASNILLDAEMTPKIADFGIARLFGVDQTQGDTSRIVGTYGYMAPEYVLHGLFSVKSDVYSFGVLVLEIITGRKNKGSQNGEYAEDLVSFVWRNWRDGTAANILDPSLSTGSRTEIIRCIHMGLLCVQESVEDRPTMSSVVLMLSSHSFVLPEPSHPAFVTHTASINVRYNSNHTTADV